MTFPHGPLCGRPDEHGNTIELADRLRVWGPAVGWAALLFVLSAVPDLGGLRGLPHGDKFGHAALYAVLGAALGYGWSRSPRYLSHLLLIGLGALYGMTDEWHQMYVPGRVPDVADWIADVVGLVIGYGTTVTLLGRKNDEEIEEAT